MRWSEFTFHLCTGYNARELNKIRPDGGKKESITHAVFIAWGVWLEGSDLMGLQRAFFHDETVDSSEIQLSNCESFERKTDRSNY